MSEAKARSVRFPADFSWGTATSSYQIEGGWMEGGKGLSIWDAFSHTPEKTRNGETGDLTSDHFHRYKEDVRLMREMGLKNYRFSISWPRVQPLGYGKENLEGIRFYSSLVDELLDNGITPWVTLYHWDLPLALALEHDGWLNPKIADFFARYAELCFKHLGDRVKNWITLNEPWVVSILGYGFGTFAPGRVSTSEPYVVAHNLLRAHGQAAELYHTRYQPGQKGRIGMSNNCDWREPLTDTPRDRDAAERARLFFLGWFADPLYRGDYPAVMRERVGERLPRFSQEDVRRIHRSCDFFGLNHYTTLYAAHAAPGEAVRGNPYDNGGLVEDQDVKLSADPNWAKTSMGWSMVPWGCRKLLLWISDRYAQPEIILTENGCSSNDVVVEGKVHDPARIEFLRAYLGEAHRAIEEGVKLRGYFAWSFMDNFEWALGFAMRFGLHYVDYATGKRIPKSSAKWFAKVMQSGLVE
ncbi:MAG: beta-glucosidase [Acidobacteria bacterium]|nr:MAG: beta-glucosidase [Acidobacteriota bacterium]